MSHCPEHNPLHHEGTAQFQRSLEALHPDYARIDERTIEDLLELTARYAKEAFPVFYNFDNQASMTLESEWVGLMDYTEFFQKPDSLSQIMSEMQQRHDFPPHFALFLCFLKLFEYLQKDINQLTQKHLDFYYKKVLRFQLETPVPDHVHVLFSLARHIAETVVETGTPLDAGRDTSVPTPRPLTYTTNELLVVNAAKIAYQRSVYWDTTTHQLFYALDAKTTDGIEKPMPKDNPSWNAFGPKPNPTAPCDNCGGSTSTKLIEYPTLKVGFAVASNILLLAEGRRTITLEITTVQPLLAPLSGYRFDIQLSGEKNWIDLKNQTLKAIAPNKLQLECVLEASEKEKIVVFDASKLDGNYQTVWPVMRCWLVDTPQYALLKTIQIESVFIRTKVEGLKKTLILENELGKVNPEKSLMLFGVQPSVGSVLYVGCDEARHKTLESVRVKSEGWIGKPNLDEHYKNYCTYKKDEPDSIVRVGDYRREEADFKIDTEIINGNLKGKSTLQKSLFSGLGAGIQIQLNTDFIDRVGFNGVLNYRIGGFVSTGNFVQKKDISRIIWGNLNSPLQNLSDSLLKIELANQDFGHFVYPKIVSDLAAFNANLAANSSDLKPIPPAPYTPVSAGIQLDYVAVSQSNQLTDGTFEAYAMRDVQFFHLGAFGYLEEHSFLKKELDFLTHQEQTSAWLMPQYSPHGTFYLGLSGIQPLEAVSILFQVEEGSANPERPTADVKWSVLVSNQWRLLNADNILKDTTQQLLTSGIVQFYLPLETTLNHTLLEEDVVWIKAELFVDDTAAPHDSVSNLIAIHPQAVLATFNDQQNAPSHYAEPLTVHTISRAREGLNAIKKIEQPYASFGGKPQETNQAFYQRVSERLRHKQRAVAIWDYEHLVLQEFPRIFKVKCLNHTRLDKQRPKTDPLRLNQLAPGNVVVVVVPDLHNINATNHLEPKVDLNTLKNIDDYLQKHTGLWVAIETTNPDYEAVRLKFKVRFKRGFPFATYQKKLNEALVAYLSPWVKDTSVDIPFGGVLEKSVVINFIERLGYVDVLRDFVMLRQNDSYEGYEQISATNPMAVLVSCPQHCISEFSGC